MKKSSSGQSKKIIGTVLAAALIVGGISTTAIAFQGEDAVKKNILLAEAAEEIKESPDQTVPEGEANGKQAVQTKVSTAEQAVTIAQDALKGLLDINITELQVEHPFTEMIAVGSSVYDVPVWNIYWASLNPSLEEYEAGAKEGEGAIPVESCGATINANTGEIISLYGQNIDANQEPANLTPEEAEKLVVEFMAKNHSMEGEVQDISLTEEALSKDYRLEVTTYNGQKSFIMVSPATGKVISWSNQVK